MAGSFYCQATLPLTWSYSSQNVNVCFQTRHRAWTVKITCTLPLLNPHSSLILWQYRASISVGVYSIFGSFQVDCILVWVWFSLGLFLEPVWLWVTENGIWRSENVFMQFRLREVFHRSDLVKIFLCLWAHILAKIEPETTQNGKSSDSGVGTSLKRLQGWNLILWPASRWTCKEIVQTLFRWLCRYIFTEAQFQVKQEVYL